MRSFAFIKLATLEYPRHEGDIRAEHPEILESQTGDTFPCPSTYAPVYWVDRPAHDTFSEWCQEGPPVQVDGKWYMNWVVSKIPDEILGKNIRNRRRPLLDATDWTQLADAPVDKAAWAAYRQALRDITSQAGYPTNVVWPTPPGPLPPPADPTRPYY